MQHVETIALEGDSGIAWSLLISLFHALLQIVVLLHMLLLWLSLWNKVIESHTYIAIQTAACCSNNWKYPKIAFGTYWRRTVMRLLPAFGSCFVLVSLPCKAILVRHILLLCVCPSLSCQYCVKTAKLRTMQRTPHDSPGTSSLMPKILAKFKQSHSQWELQMQVG